MIRKAAMSLLLLGLFTQSQASIFGFTNWFFPSYQSYQAQPSNQYQYSQEGKRQRNQYSSTAATDAAKNVNILNFQILPDGDEDTICRRPSRIQNYYKIMLNKDSGTIRSNQVTSASSKQSQYKNEDKTTELVGQKQVGNPALQNNNNDNQNKGMVSSKRIGDSQENTRLQSPANSQSRVGTPAPSSNSQMKGAQGNNIVQGSDNKLNGFQNTIQGNKNILIGIGNHLSGDSNKVSGTQNGLIGNQNAAAGKSNAIVGNGNVVVGSSNVVFGTENKVQGNSNGIQAGKSIIKGNNNIIKS